MSHKVQPRAFTTKPRHNHPRWVNPPTSPCPTLSAAQLPEFLIAILDDGHKFKIHW